MTADAQAPVQVTVWSDPVCPWCWIGERHLAAALERDDRLAARVRLHWRPFQLNPGLPRTGIARQAYLAAKFGASAPAFYARIADLGRELGLDFHFERIAVQPNTADAHRLIQRVQALVPACTPLLIERLFEAFFVAGRDIGDHRVLLELAAAAGVDTAGLSAWLAGDEGRDSVAAAQIEATHRGIHGVPQFVVADQPLPGGAVGADALTAALRAAAQMVAG